MTRWFTADLHFGHANIIRYCDRPWPDVDAMDRGLINRWNATVADDDEVWVLGDVAMGRIDDSLRLIGELPAPSCSSLGTTIGAGPAAATRPPSGSCATATPGSPMSSPRSSS